MAAGKYESRIAQQTKKYIEESAAPEVQPVTAVNESGTAKTRKTDSAKKVKAKTEEIIQTPAKKVGAPKKRKEGDRKMNFFLDEDLAAGIDYMTYGTTFTKYVNKLIRADMVKNLAARKALVDQLDD